MLRPALAAPAQPGKYGFSLIDEVKGSGVGSAPGLLQFPHALPEDGTRPALGISAAKKLVLITLV